MKLPARLRTGVGIARSLLIYYGQPWRRRALKRFYGDLIGPGALAFDIGAHVGSRTATLLSLGADVVAIEPQPIFADFIAWHFAKRLKGFERVAVSAREGETVLRVSSRHPTVTTISNAFVDGVADVAGFRGVTWDREVGVPVTTLDRLIARYGRPDFCKIDVEGAEAEILAGLSQPLPLVAFEYTPAVPAIATAAIAHLAALGDYRFNRVVGERHRFIEPDWRDGPTMLATLSTLPPESPSGDIYARLNR